MTRHDNHLLIKISRTDWNNTATSSTTSKNATNQEEEQRTTTRTTRSTRRSRRSCSHAGHDSSAAIMLQFTSPGEERHDSSSVQQELIDEDEQSAIILELENDYMNHTKGIGWMFVIVCSFVAILSLFLGYKIKVAIEQQQQQQQQQQQHYQSSSISSSLYFLSSSASLQVCTYAVYVALVHVGLGYTAFHKFIIVNLNVNGNEKKLNRGSGCWVTAKTAVRIPKKFMLVLVLVLVLISVLIPASLWWMTFFTTTSTTTTTITTEQQWVLQMLLLLGGSNLMMFVFLVYMDKDNEKILKQLLDLNLYRYKLKSV